MSRRRHERVFIASFLAPALLLFTVFVAYPSVRALAYSLQKWDGLGEAEWIGFGNFVALFADRTLFLAALAHNLFLMVVGSILILLLALFFATLIHRRVRGAGIFRVAYFFPNVISSVAIALLWMWLYSPTDFGVFNAFLRQLDLGKSTVRVSDVRDPGALVDLLRRAETTGALPESVRVNIESISDTPNDREALATTLNALLRRRDLASILDWQYAPEMRLPRDLMKRALDGVAASPDRWDEFELSPGARNILETYEKTRRDEEDPDTLLAQAFQSPDLRRAALSLMTDNEIERFNRRMLELESGSESLRPLRKPFEAAFRVVGVDWLRIDLPFPFTESRYLILSLIPMLVWTAVGFYMILFLAAMENIPESYYEVAELEGASTFAQFWHITLPLIREVLTVGLIFLVIGGLRLFDPVWVMENQWPRPESHVLATLLYQKVFTEYNVGYGSAVAVVLFVLMFAGTLITLRLSRKEAYEY